MAPTAEQVDRFISNAMITLKPIVTELVKVAVARATEPPKEEADGMGVVADEDSVCEGAFPPPVDIKGRPDPNQLRATREYNERLLERDACRLRAADESDRLVEDGLLPAEFANDHVRHALDDFDQEEKTDSLSEAQISHRHDTSIGLRYGDFINSRFTRG